MKLPIKFVVSETYQTVTPLSVLEGEPSDQGFSFKDELYEPEELADYLSNEGFVHPSSSHLTGSKDYLMTKSVQDQNYFEKGEETTKSLHLEKIIDADGIEIPSEIQDRLWINVLKSQLNSDHELDKESDSILSFDS